MVTLFYLLALHMLSECGLLNDAFKSQNYTASAFLL